jgi:hypothetical protein
MQTIRLKRHDVKAASWLFRQTHQKVPGRKHNPALFCRCDAGQCSAMRATPALSDLDKYQGAIAVTKN